jgi:hypothetical protein
MQACMASAQRTNTRACTVNCQPGSKQPSASMAGSVADWKARGSPRCTHQTRSPQGQLHTLSLVPPTQTPTQVGACKKPLVKQVQRPQGETALGPGTQDKATSYHLYEQQQQHLCTVVAAAATAASTAADARLRQAAATVQAATADPATAPACPPGCCCGCCS